MLNTCCPSGCNTTCSGNQIAIPLEQFKEDPAAYRPALYEKFQLDMLSEAGYNAYMGRIKSFNEMCNEIDRKDLLIDAERPWTEDV